MKKFFSIIFFIFMLLLMLVIGNYNNNPVSIHFLIVQTQWPLAAVMALMLFCGFIFGLVAALIIGMGKSKNIKPQARIEDQDKASSTQSAGYQPPSQPSASTELLESQNKS